MTFFPRIGRERGMDYLHVVITCIYGMALRLLPGIAADSFAPPTMDPDDLRPRTTRGFHRIRGESEGEVDATGEIVSEAAALLP